LPAAVQRELLKEFGHVAPDEHGNVEVRVMAASDSPDQNAKINGIEILKDPSDLNATR
jgi:hypothetical protein